MASPNDDVIQALAANRLDQPFGRHSARVRSVRSACLDGTQSTSDNAAINAITVSDMWPGASFQGNCLGYLTRDPFGG
jgi:hypothetical protein